jgi:integrase
MRVPKPWLRKQTGTWYVQIDGVQHPLGKDKKEADKKYHRLMAGEGLARPREDSLPALIEHFLADAARSVTPKTLTWYREFLEDFAARNPRLKASDIAPRHVRAWTAAEHKRPWGQSTRRSAVTILKRLLNWAVENRLLERNPIADLEREAAVRRERVLTDEERARILGWYPEGDPFRDFLVALMESGARPGEVARVEARDVGLADGTWTVSNKTGRKTGQKRVIYMTAALHELTRRLMERHPEGPLFRNEDGKPWTLQAINCRFRRKRNRKVDALDRDVTAYVYRATWATDALENEVPDAAVAALMGHSGTATLHRHYSKIHEKRKFLREQAEKAVRARDPIRDTEPPAGVDEGRRPASVPGPVRPYSDPPSHVATKAARSPSATRITPRRPACPNRRHFSRFSAIQA